MKDTKMQEKKPYGTGKVVFLSFLCVLLTFVLGTLLLGSLTARHIIKNGDIAGAASSIPLDKVTLSDGTSLAAAINQKYVQNPQITDVNVEHILRDGTFRNWVGTKADSYAQFLRTYKTRQVNNFPKVTVNELQTLISANDPTIRLHTGIHDFGRNNTQVAQAASADIDAFNATMESTLGTGGTASLIRLFISDWCWIVLGIFLLLVMIWLIVIHVRGKRHVGTAFKTFAITGVIPSLLVFLAGAFGQYFLHMAGLNVFDNAFLTLHKIPMMIGGFGALGCAVLFGFGVLWNTIAHKEPAAELPEAPAAEAAPSPVPDPLPVPDRMPVVEENIVPDAEPETEEEPKVIRKFCRFCGGELVNSDAMFCYKCGKPQ